MTKTSAVGPNKGGFVFGESTEKGPNKVLGAQKLEAYLVQYTDGASKECVRIAFRVPGAKDAFILQERIQGQYVATAGTKWFNEALTSKLQAAGTEKASVTEGKEGVEAV